jgi:hypothetical protein
VPGLLDAAAVRRFNACSWSGGGDDNVMSGRCRGDVADRRLFCEDDRDRRCDGTRARPGLPLFDFGTRVREIALTDRPAGLARHG